MKHDFLPVMESTSVSFLMLGAVLAVLICLLMTAAPAQADSARRRYCGDGLTSALSLLCDGVYKRAESTRHYDSDYDEPKAHTDYEDDVKDVFKDRQAALMLVKTRSFRDKRGVVSECCRKACTLSELTSYCGVKDS